MIWMHLTLVISTISFTMSMLTLAYQIYELRKDIRRDVEWSKERVAGIKRQAEEWAKNK